MKNIKGFIVGLITSLFLSGCCGSGARVCPASRSILNQEIELVNFSVAETDSVVVKIYQASSNFTNPLDSEISTGTFYRNPQSATDSTFCTFAYSGSKSDLSDPDLSLLFYFPSDSLTYKVIHVIDTTTYCHECPGHNVADVYAVRYTVVSPQDTVTASLPATGYNIIIAK